MEPLIPAGLSYLNQRRLPWSRSCAKPTASRRSARHARRGDWPITMLGLFSPQTFLGRAQRKLARSGVPVFMYHKVVAPPPETCDPFLYTSPTRFQAQLASLRHAGFSSAALDDISGA